MTITESKKKYIDNGRFHYEKHKLFLYKEDFEKFAESLNEVIQYIKENQPERQPENQKEKLSEDLKGEVVSVEDEPVKDYTHVDFEDI